MDHATLLKHQCELTLDEQHSILRAISDHGTALQQARRAYPRNRRAQRDFERGFYAEISGARDGLTGSRAENAGRAACRVTYDLPGTNDRERTLIDLAARSPLRGDKDQADAGHLPLFISANEPRML